MKQRILPFAAILVLHQAWAAQDMACMQECYRQGSDRSSCISLCSMSGPGGGGLLDQPGLPKNPAFDQIQPNSPRPQLPAVADPACMRDCQKRGYAYAFCYKKVCSYVP